MAQLSPATLHSSLSLDTAALGLLFRLQVLQCCVQYSNIILFTREIGVFDTDHSFVTSFTNPAFLFPLGIAFNMQTKEAFILGKLFILGCSISYSSCV